MPGIDFDDKPDDGVGELRAVGSVEVLERAAPAIGDLALMGGNGYRKRDHGRGTEEAAAEVLRLVRINGAQRVEADEGSQNLVQIYLREIGEFPLISKEDEVRLSAEIAAGKAALTRLTEEDSRLSELEKANLLEVVDRSEAARLAFIQANLRFVVYWAKIYTNTTLSLLERIQLGNQGLIRAVEKFDGRKGFAFSTYATWWIRQSISKGIDRSEGSVRVSRKNLERIKAFYRAREKFVQDHQREGTIDEIIANSRLDYEKTKEALRFARNDWSLNSGVHKETETELGDTLADNYAASPEDEAARSIDTAELIGYLDMLTDTERQNLELFYGVGYDRAHTNNEIADIMGITVTVAASSRDRATGKLRHPTSEFMLSAEEWRQKARCLGLDNTPFFPSRGKETKTAKDTCAVCSVKEDCLIYALRNSEKIGIWGGTSERERRKLRIPKK